MVIHFYICILYIKNGVWCLVRPISFSAAENNLGQTPEKNSLSVKTWKQKKKWKQLYKSMFCLISHLYLSETLYKESSNALNMSTRILIFLMKLMLPQCSSVGRREDIINDATGACPLARHQTRFLSYFLFCKLNWTSTTHWKIWRSLRYPSIFSAVVLGGYWADFSQGCHPFSSSLSLLGSSHVYGERKKHVLDIF